MKTLIDFIENNYTDIHVVNCFEKYSMANLDVNLTDYREIIKHFIIECKERNNDIITLLERAQN